MLTKENSILITRRRALIVGAGLAMQVMRQQGWDIGCLYNQETDEHPQLYFPISSKPATRSSWRMKFSTG